LRDIGVDRRFSSHGLRRTAVITGHVTQRMTEHYSHVDVGEKKAAVEGMLKLVKGGRQVAV
jgi:hypothetical protein